MSMAKTHHSQINRVEAWRQHLQCFNIAGPQGYNVADRDAEMPLMIRIYLEVIRKGRPCDPHQFHSTIRAELNRKGRRLGVDVTYRRAHNAYLRFVRQTDLRLQIEQFIPGAQVWMLEDLVVCGTDLLVRRGPLWLQVWCHLGTENAFSWEPTKHRRQLRNSERWPTGRDGIPPLAAFGPPLVLVLDPDEGHHVVLQTKGADVWLYGSQHLRRVRDHLNELNHPSDA
jgi:hypothetical protein